jgi:hypothetical protein
MAQAIAKPTYVNKQSERLLQRAANSGREVRGIDAGSKTPRTMASMEYSQRFDNEYGSAAPTPRGSTSRSHSRATSPMMTPRTPRSSLARTTPAREPASSSARHAKSKSPSRSPDSPPQKLAFTTPMAHLGATSRTGGRGVDSSQDDIICSANPNSIGDCASDIKWMARMSGKTGVEPRPRSRGASPARASRTASSGFNPFGEMDKMRLEFQRIMREKEVARPWSFFQLLPKCTPTQPDIPL